MIDNNFFIVYPPISSSVSMCCTIQIYIIVFRTVIIVPYTVIIINTISIFGYKISLYFFVKYKQKKAPHYVVLKVQMNHRLLGVYKRVNTLKTE
jgi:hypothetical protein